MPSAEAPECIFCKIIRREAPASIVREDAETLAFMDIRPMTPGHVLVIPKLHAAYLEELPAGTAGTVFEAAREISGAMRRSGLRCEAVSIYLANGKEAGQVVYHVHIHLIPRFEGDGFGLRVTPGYGRVAAREELDGFAARIRDALDREGGRA